MGAEAHKLPQPLKDCDLQKPKAVNYVQPAECNAGQLTNLALCDQQGFGPGKCGILPLGNHILDTATYSSPLLWSGFYFMKMEFSRQMSAFHLCFGGTRSNTCIYYPGLECSYNLNQRELYYRRTSISGTTFSGKKCRTNFHAI
jgi:hypothetical protein